MCYKGLLPFILHPDKLRIGLILANLNCVILEVLITTRVLFGDIIGIFDVAAKFLDFEIVEALMHQKVNPDHLVELVDAQPANCLEYSEEDHTEDA